MVKKRQKHVNVVCDRPPSVQKIRQNYLCARCWRPFLDVHVRARVQCCYLNLFFFVVCLMFCRMLIVECWRKLSVRFRQATFFIRSKLQLFPTRLILVGKAFFSERAKVRNYFVYMIMIHNFKRYCLLSAARIKILHTDRLDF